MYEDPSSRRKRGGFFQAKGTSWQSELGHKGFANRSGRSSGSSSTVATIKAAGRAILRACGRPDGRSRKLCLFVCFVFLFMVGFSSLWIFLATASAMLGAPEPLKATTNLLEESFDTRLFPELKLELTHHGQQSVIENSPVFNMPRYNLDARRRQEATSLVERFRFNVMNLDRRGDKLLCVQEQFSKVGIFLHRISSVDASKLKVDDFQLLDEGTRGFLRDHPNQLGHAGCLYSHVKFWIATSAMYAAQSAERARGVSTCPAPSMVSVSCVQGGPPAQEVMVLFDNTEGHSSDVELYWVDYDGKEIPMRALQLHQKVTISSKQGHAWRIRGRVSHRLLQEVQIRHPKGAKLEKAQRTALKGSGGISYDSNSRGLKATVMVETCVGRGGRPPRPQGIAAGAASRAGAGAAGVTKGNGAGSPLMFTAEEEHGYPDIVGVNFEDDMLPNPDMASRLLTVFKEKAIPEDWDVLLLNWYCNAEHWQECHQNDGKDDRYINKDVGLVKTKFFMSGGGYAVSPRGILKLVQSLPCRERVCSMAVDWHMSMMIERGELNVYGFVPSLLKMPDQGWLHAYNIPAPSKEETEICESYVSDTHNEGQKTESQKVEELVDRWRSGKGLIGAYYGMEGSAIQGLASEDLPGVEVYRDWKTWKEAEEFCTIRNGHLATIASSEQNEAMRRLVAKACGGVPTRINGWDLCAWVGLNDFAQEGIFEWAGSRQSKFRNFLEGEPNNMNGEEDGIALCWNMKGKWIDSESNEAREAALSHWPREAAYRRRDTDSFLAHWKVSNDATLPCHVCEYPLAEGQGTGNEASATPQGSGEEKK